MLVTIIMVMGYRFSKATIYDNIFHRVRLQTISTVNPIFVSMEETRNVIEVLASEIEESNNPRETAKLLELVLKGNPNILSVGFLVRDELNPLKLQSLRSYFRDEEPTGQNSLINGNNEWLMDRFYKMDDGWSDPYTDSLSGHFIVQYANSVTYKSKGKMKSGIIHCAVSLDDLLTDLKNFKIQKSGKPIVINQTGSIVYYPNSEFLGNKYEDIVSDLDHVHLNLKEIVQKRSSGTQIMYPGFFNQRKSVAVYWPLDSINWSIIIVVPISEFYNELHRLLTLVILIILLIGSITAAITMYLSIRLISPITDLVDDSRKMLAEVGVNLPQNRNEIEILSDGIELMKYRLDNFKNDSLKKSMDRAEIDKELNLAKEIEMGMVPTQFPLYPGRIDFDCYGKLIPAKTVGGDLFDIFLLDDNNLFISICDTLGKGIPAAMFSVVTRTLIRSIANPITRLGKIMEQLNDELSFDGKSEMFVTVFLAKLDLKTGELTYCNAGHPHPLIARNSKMVDELEMTHGIPVGVRTNQHFKESSVFLNSGDSLVAYTDGITEEIDEIGEFFGPQRLMSVIRIYAEETSERLVEEILNSVDQFKAKSEATDDTTLLSVKYIGKSKHTRN